MNKISAFPISLSQSWHGDNEIAFVNHHTIGKHKELLQKAYDNLYIKVFPLAKGGVEIERWFEDMENPRATNNDIRILVAGKNLNDPKKAEIHGISVSIYFRDNDVGLLAYITVDPDARVNGLGHTMHEIQARELWKAARENKKNLKGWYIECYAPEKVGTGFDGYDSQKLVDKYVKWGAKRLPIDYVVPDTHNCAIRDHSLTLLAGAHPVTKQHPDAQTNLNYIRSLWTLEGVSQAEQNRDPAMITMASQLGLPIAANDHKQRTRKFAQHFSL